MKREYTTKLISHIEKATLENKEIDEAATAIADCIDNDGLIYMFGCGHSHILSEEFFYRAGGLANVQPILYEPIMLHQGAAQSSVNEKKNGFTDNFISNYQITNNDVLIVISTSGINPVPIDVARYGKSHGAKVITISSFEYPKLEQSRHQDSYFLKDVGDINIDNKVIHGDAILETNGFTHSPISSIIGMSILHEIVSNGIDLAKTEQLPVFRSGNVSGSAEYNKQLVSKYKDRIPMLGLNLEE